MSQDNPLLNFKEAMAYLRVSRSTLYRLMSSGQLKGYKVFMTWRFYKHDLDQCIRSSPGPISLQPVFKEISIRLCGHAEIQLWCPSCIAYASLSKTET